VTRTGDAAIDWAHARVGNGPPPPHGMDQSGLCLQFTRQCFDVPSHYGSAIDAWNANPAQHPGDRHPPPAVPVWFWSSSPYRHVAFWDGSVCVTTYNDDVRVYSLDDMEHIFGGYMGWAPEINTVTIYAPPPDPAPEDDMTPAESNMLFHIGALLEQTPVRTAETVHNWQISRVPGAPTTFLQDQTDGVSNTYALVEDAAATGTRRWTPGQVVLFLLALAVVVLVLLAPVVLRIEDAAVPYLGVVGVLASAVAAVVATRGHRDPVPRPVPHVPTAPPAREPRDPGTDPGHDLDRFPQDRGD
jgi:hypothetical protein